MTPTLIKLAIDPQNISVYNQHQQTFTTTSQLDNLINTQWNQALNKAYAQQKTLYNGLSLRLDNYTITDRRLYLNLSHIDYKNRYSRERLYANNTLTDPEFEVRGLTVGAILKTVDNYYMFGKLSSYSMNENDIIYIAGGVEDLSLSTPNGLIDELLREIKEETGIPPEHISINELTALRQSANSSYLLLYSATITLTKQQIAECFSHSDHEMQELIFATKDQLPQILNNQNSSVQSILQLI